MNYDNIFTVFFRLSASFCPGAACPAVGPQAAQIPRQVGIAAPDMSGIQHPHAAPSPHQGPPAPVLPRPAGLVQSQWHHAILRCRQGTAAVPRCGHQPPGRQNPAHRQSGFGTGRHKCGMLPPPPAAPLQPAGSICGKARVSSRYKFLTAAQLCILIPRDAKLIFPAGNLAAAALQKVQKRRQPHRTALRYRHPPACNGGGCRISRCGNAVRQHGMHTAVQQLAAGTSDADHRRTRPP